MEAVSDASIGLQGVVPRWGRHQGAWKGVIIVAGAAMLQWSEPALIHARPDLHFRRYATSAQVTSANIVLRHAPVGGTFDSPHFQYCFINYIISYLSVMSVLHLNRTISDERLSGRYFYI